MRYTKINWEFYQKMRQRKQENHDFELKWPDKQLPLLQLNERTDDEDHNKKVQIFNTENQLGKKPSSNTGLPYQDYTSRGRISSNFKRVANDSCRESHFYLSPKHVARVTRVCC